jgi:hypothetical protein
MLNSFFSRNAALQSCVMPDHRTNTPPLPLHGGEAKDLFSITVHEGPWHMEGSTEKAENTPGWTYTKPSHRASEGLRIL